MSTLWGIVQNVTAEKAMKALKIPQEEQEFYLAQLQSNTP